MGVFASAFKALAHGTLNWDTQLNADMSALEGLFDATATDRTAGGTYTGDWNNATSPGAYKIASGNANQNSPIGVGAYAYGTLIVSTSGQSVTQLYGTHVTPTLWWRTKYNAADWTAWSIALGQYDAPSVAYGTAASGFSYNRFTVTRYGRNVAIDFSAYRNGGTITGTTSGNIPNVLVGTLGFNRPSTAWAPLAPGPGGPTCSYAMDGNGNLYLCAMPPSYNLTNGQELSCGGSFITNS